jgi:hypothetical protein
MPWFSLSPVKNEGREKIPARTTTCGCTGASMKSLVYTAIALSLFASAEATAQGLCVNIGDQLNSCSDAVATGTAAQAQVGTIVTTPRNDPGGAVSAPVGGISTFAGENGAGGVAVNLGNGVTSFSENNGHEGIAVNIGNGVSSLSND